MTIRTNITWWEALICLFLGFGAGSQGVGIGILTAMATAIMFGVWRLVRITGKTLEYTQAAAQEYEEQD